MTASLLSMLVHPAFWAVLCVLALVFDLGVHVWMMHLGRQGRLQAMFDGLSRWQARGLHLGLLVSGKLMVFFGGCTAVAVLHQIL
ncbi:hypothetical protein [Thioclava sp. GXIMD4216]|uniref:Uncharacterized protein n=1 Tax=Thioclava litoralis TaxID=3076557 RepID=A0ABZ1E106_9RHOB|nr:hypothetical protein RPE78_13275 [Thioclava sp. FTW29]